MSSHLNSLVQPEAMEQPDPRHYNDFLQNSVQILDTLVLGIELPPEIVAAINRQTQQYYEIQEYKYRVQREAEELTRKQIEANGIAAFQRTVSDGYRICTCGGAELRQPLRWPSPRIQKSWSLAAVKTGFRLYWGTLISRRQQLRQMTLRKHANYLIWAAPT